jgi:hypothetical protein
MRAKTRAWILLMIWALAVVGIAGAVLRERIMSLERCIGSNNTFSACWVSVGTSWELP